MAQRSETAPGVSETLSYTYDGQGRLLRAQRGATVVENYAYDANGNRSQANGQLASYDTQDRLTDRVGVAIPSTPTASSAPGARVGAPPPSSTARAENWCGPSWPARSSPTPTTGWAGG